jgi:hypothetical protein
MIWVISYAANDMSSFQRLPWHEQRVALLKRLAGLFPRGFPSTIDVWSRSGGGDMPSRLVSNPNGLAHGFPENELECANNYLLKYPWRDIVHNGYVIRQPRWSGHYEIADEGWAVVEQDAYMPL